MANMNMPDSWANEDALIDHLATQLVRGRLGLFLGAGVSQFYGLPSWAVLLERLCDAVGEPKPDPSEDPIKKAAYLRAEKFTDPQSFKAAVKTALYQGITLDFAEIRKNLLLASIGSLVMSSRRGAAAKVITLNYDDLLENYLEYHGFTTATVSDAVHWRQDEDVVVYHPHGYLPLGHSADSEAIVLTSDEYHKIMSSPLWRPILDTALRQHTFLYLGLSGDDLHLQNLWHDLTANHAISRDRIQYHGVRFAIEGKKDETAAVAKAWGIYTHRLVDHGALPDFLFRICQAARIKRMSV